ncbi:hypothetical protein XFLAVUS301_00180 [Xanthobacter flavus]|uniref:Uncharacterized protein n=1 Tax=Xanthobacter flavus TaxID=281 RepID=A0A9W6CGQ3_XANFL|nr:hypothetical protein XFLAVUS301_00180 [Xanthobacter flavus]
MTLGRADRSAAKVGITLVEAGRYPPLAQRACRRRTGVGTTWKRVALAALESAGAGWMIRGRDARESDDDSRKP